MSEQKFNKGDLVEIVATGERLIVNDYLPDGSLTTIVTGYYCELPDIELKLIKPAKQYITVNGHKVPKPLKIPTNLYYTPSLQADDLYDSHGFDLNFPDDAFALSMVSRGLCFGTKEDAIAMSKALLSAIPKD